MRKITELNDIVVQEVGGLNVNQASIELIRFCDYLRVLETEFQKLNPNIQIGFKPIYEVQNDTKSWNLKIMGIDFQLCENDTVLLAYATNKEYIKLLGVAHYEVINSSMYVESNVETIVSFSVDPELYKAIVEDKMISAFVENEKELKMKKAEDLLNLKINKPLK